MVKVTRLGSRDRHLVHPSMTELRIGYFNVGGLSPDKHRICCGLMDVGLFDVLFLSETWFIKCSSYMSHPYSFLQTVNENHDSKYRGREGLLAMLNPRARSLVHSFRALPKALWIDFGQAKVLATYLPPSMSEAQVGSCIADFPPYDFLVGDINVRFTGITKKSPSTRTRQDLWTDHLRSRASSFLIPTREPLVLDVESPTIPLGQALITFQNCELDHAIGSSSAPPCELTLVGSRQFRLQSDHHYILLCSISLPSFSEPTQRAPGLDRFHLERLEDERVLKRLRESWRDIDRETDWDVGDVEDYDLRLLSAVSKAADSVLGRYDVLDRKRSSDAGPSKYIHAQTSTLAAIRLFKRKRRSNGGSRLESRSEESTPMEECTEKYRDLFSDPEGTPDPPRLFEDDGLLPELRGYVAVAKIAEFVRKYPKDRSCGIDGVHTNLMAALVGTTFFPRLNRLFVLCLEVGRVPKRWNDSVMFLLPKDKQGPVTCDTVRPLSILPMFRRTFESLLLPAFTSGLDYCKLHPSQAGFRRGYSAMTQALICHHAIDRVK